MVMSKRTRIYTPEDVAAHNTRDSCWVSRNGKVYDVTSFVADHPGGDELILNNAGKDVEQLMADKDEHEHSESAYDMLDEYIIGRLLYGETVVRDGSCSTSSAPPTQDFEKNQFLDLRRPLVMQIWYANFSKSYYLKQVHQPRHAPDPVRFFGPSYLEVFTRTKWYIVPLVWGPITFNLFMRSLVGFSRPLAPFVSAPTLPYTSAALDTVTMGSVVCTIACFVLGNIIWTLLEYFLHRFLFHVDDYLPEHPFALVLHFLLHGVHHYVPMDRLRLVMPPILFAALSIPFTRLAYALFPTPMANGVIAGSYAFYADAIDMLYDCMHYALHHTQLPTYLREMKKYHLAHHYKNFELGFGVTSKIWDIVFSTVLPT
ncbi:hypothetical protein EW145_g5809 [Phellinidium pouzarii]|uniref:Ceramide very long chain fatty acid hydroxylase n=1 Tax=Phellinidium pouzarii TaxID=167371 RepID=A0A4S4KYR0_9AGAM|nr:hypothetical protein EW145_g5809 [Phellinidium pouzarii]